MKASQFTDARKSFIIKQNEDGASAAEIHRKAGSSSNDYYAPYLGRSGSNPRFPKAD